MRNNCGGRGGGRGSGGTARSASTFYGGAKTTEEMQATWDSCYMYNVKARLCGGRNVREMPAERPGRRRAAPGDPRNKKLNEEHEALLGELRDRARREWEKGGGKIGAGGDEEEEEEEEEGMKQHSGESVERGGTKRSSGSTPPPTRQRSSKRIACAAAAERR
jgi:hypothetical protein